MTAATRSPDTRARLVVTPSPALIDEPVTIRLTDGLPGQAVTIHARMRDAFGGRLWESHAAFEADPSGVIDLSTRAPLHGTYQGVDPRGLFWSMALTTPDEPALPWSGALPLDTELVAEADGTVVGEARLTRLFTSPDVTKTPVRDNGLVATFFEPAGPGPHACVIVLGGSGGGLPEGSAALLASHGFAVLALAYFRAEHLPEDLVGIPLEYFETAIRWLQRQPSVRGARLGVIGSSRGGELALLLGATFAQFGAVVGNVPSGVVHAGLSKNQTPGSPPRPAWLYHGDPITFLQSRDSARARAEAPVDGPLALTPIFLKMLEDAAAVERATIPVERINGPVLLISGQDDQMWPSPTLAEIAMRRLAAHRHPHAYEHLSYPGAGHVIGPPGLPATLTAIYHRLAGRRMAFGGNPPDNAAAAADSWPRVIEFFHRALEQP